MAVLAFAELLVYPPGRFEMIQGDKMEGPDVERRPGLLPEPAKEQSYGLQQPPTVMTVAPKNPAVHLLVSVFFPGVGTMMNGRVGKGLAILVGYFVCWLLFLLVFPLLIAFGIWVYGLVDAYQGAKKWNLAHGIIS